MTAASVCAPGLREVRLYGALGRQFGRLFRLAVATPAEAVQALRAVLPGFERAFVGSDGRASYHVFVGRGPLRRDIGKEEAEAPLGEADPIRFVPVVQGAKRQGVWQTIAGVVLIVAGFANNGNPELIRLGVALLLGGVVGLLSPQRRKEQEREKTPSYAFDGPINNTEQGGPVPLVFGRVICGSTVVSQGLSTEQVVLSPPTWGPDPTLPAYEPEYPWPGNSDGI